MAKLSKNFVIEMLALGMKQRRFLETALQHVKFSFLPSEEHKEVWKAISTFYENSNSLLTYGLLSEQLSTNKEAQELIAQMKKAQLPKMESALEQLEEFIRTNMFMSAYDKLADTFNKGDKDVAFNLFKSKGVELAEFSLRDTHVDAVYSQFHQRHQERVYERDMGDLKSSRKIPLGIDAFDRITRGGVDKGDTVLILGQSGAGKSKMLKSCGVAASRRGHKVVHIQAEGTHRECMDAYDASISGQKLWNVEHGHIKPDILQQMKRAERNITGLGGEIYVETFEQFDSATMVDVRKIVEDLVKKHGQIDVLILDYLELLDPGDKKRYSTGNEGERRRREVLANKFKNICVEFNIVGITATQASTVSPQALDDPEFVQTRFNISEFKGIVKPFSYFITLNQTKDEKRKRVIRLYFDKVRKYAGGQIVPIATNFDRERFYDRQRTINEFGQYSTEVDD